MAHIFLSTEAISGINLRRRLATKLIGITIKIDVRDHTFELLTEFVNLCHKAECVDFRPVKHLLTRVSRAASP